MIVYRKGHPLRLRRWSAPEPPYWAAVSIAPYSSRRAEPIAIDYLELRATQTEKLEVAVCENVREELERSTQKQRLPAPVLIDATEFAEQIFRRGEEALTFCATDGCAALQLVSTRGTLPVRETTDAVIAICAWPLEFDRLERLFGLARERGLRWGVAVPILYPVTTHLPALAQLAELAKQYGATFLASLPIELDPTAKHALAETLAAEDDDETYAMLFHADLEPVHVATERHLAALAAEHGLADFIVPPRWERHSNWNGAVLLTLAATRMLAMEEEVELASTLTRSARALAELEKPIERIAEAASLGIVETLDEISVDILTEWLESGRSAFVERVNQRWRLRRDHF